MNDSGSSGFFSKAMQMVSNPKFALPAIRGLSIAGLGKIFKNLNRDKDIGFI